MEYSPEELKAAGDILREQDQSRREIRREQDKTRKTNRILIGLLALAVVGVTALYLAGVRGEAARDGRIDRMNRCILEQLAEHREANRAAHQATAEKIDAPYNIPAEKLPPEAPIDLKKYCDEFLVTE